MKTIIKVALLTVILSGVAHAEHKQGYGSQVNNNRAVVPEFDASDIPQAVAILVGILFLVKK